MSIRTPRVIAALLLLSAIVAFVAPTAAAGSAEGDAFETLGNCVQNRRHLLVLALLDESASLKDTDPGGQRVTALRGLLTNLANVGRGRPDGSPPTVEVLLAGFSADFAVHADWAPLTQATLPQLDEQAAKFSQRNTGLDTDFAAALLGARDALAAKTAAVTSNGAPAPCKALVLFTDGDYDIEVRNTGQARRFGRFKPYAPDIPLEGEDQARAAEEAGRTLICAGGLTDELRGSEVTLVTFALTRAIREDEAFLQRLSTGQAPGEPGCGSLREPPGAYFGTDEGGALLAAFDRLGTIGTPLPPGYESTVVCQVTASVQCQRAFTLDPFLRGFHLLASVDAESMVVELRSPAGKEPLRLTPQTTERQQLGSVPLTVTHLSPLDIVVDAELPADSTDWVGPWSLVFLDPTGATPGGEASYQIILLSDLAPALVGQPRLRAGLQTTLEIGVVDERRRAPQNPARLVQKAEIVVAATDPVTGSTQPLQVSGPGSDGRYTAVYTPGAGTTSSSLGLLLTLNVVTRSGVALQPRSQQYDLPVEPPASYPRIEPGRLRLGSIREEGAATGTLEIVGGETSGGCVWFGGATGVRGPANSGGLSVRFSPDATSQSRCVHVAQGARATVQVTAAPEAVRTGTVEAGLVVRSISDADPTVIERVVPLSFEMFRSVNELKRAGLFLAILLPGLLLPLVVLWLLNWWTARFEAPGTVRHAALPVRIRERSGVMRVGDDDRERTLALFGDDLRYLGAPTQACRRFSAEGLTFRCHSPLVPVRRPYATAQALGLDTVASEGQRQRSRKTVGVVPFALPGSWILVPERFGEHDDALQIDGTLHIFVAEGAFETQARGLSETINRPITDAALRLAASKKPAASPEEGPVSEPAPVAAPLDLSPRPRPRDRHR